MSQRPASRTPRPTALRLCAAAVGAGLGVTALLGAGTAVAADRAGAPARTGAAASVAAQADALAKAATRAERAAAKKAAAWVDPVDAYKLSATFGTGGSMWAHKHSGQDFAVPVGTPVKAVHAGTVVKAGPNGGGDGPAYGNAVVVRHADHTYSQYAHLSRINVRIGQTISTDQRIALSGNTGNTSGPHLHFEIRTTPNYGSAVNPVAFLRTAGVKV
ncbi:MULTISPECIES: M23 family metallopeptidase [unclassified Streptomyces]|uniref:M23 family metallopeptidase n=1 Tax=unclassified Streptomyces TaxID=2593676 RepID=UPI0033DAED66